MLYCQVKQITKKQLFTSYGANHINLIWGFTCRKDKPDVQFTQVQYFYSKINVMCYQFIDLTVHVFIHPWTAGFTIWYMETLCCYMIHHSQWLQIVNHAELVKLDITGRVSRYMWLCITISNAAYSRYWK
jgi:hypothetical protein